MKVAIIGGARSSLELAPYDDETIEIWSLNDVFELMPCDRYDRWFEMHPPDVIRAYRPGMNDRGYVKELAALGCPVYMCEAMPDVPNSVEYPLDKMIERFGGYFTNSVSYMLAMAIAEGYEEIHLYGVEMSISSEYIFERPSVEYFVGLARGMGISVIIPEISTLSRAYWMYGYDTPVQGDVKAVIDITMPTRHIKILTAVAGEDFAFAPGDTVEASEIIAIDLICAGHAEPLEATRAGPARDVAALDPPEKAVLPAAAPKKAGGRRGK